MTPRGRDRDDSTSVVPTRPERRWSPGVSVVSARFGIADRAGVAGSVGSVCSPNDIYICERCAACIPYREKRTSIFEEANMDP